MTKRLFIAVITMVTLGLGLPALALADNITNSVDATADERLETLTLTAGGSAGTVTLSVQPTNGDGRNGCNFGGGGSPTLTVSVTSSNALVATASPSTIVFSGCGSAPTLSISPLTVGSTDITLFPVCEHHHRLVQPGNGQLHRERGRPDCDAGASDRHVGAADVGAADVGAADRALPPTAVPPHAGAADDVGAERLWWNRWWRWRLHRPQSRTDSRARKPASVRLRCSRPWRIRPRASARRPRSERRRVANSRDTKGAGGIEPPAPFVIRIASIPAAAL